MRPPATASGPAVELCSIGKSFGTVRALHGVDLNVERGTVHGIVGENGAGKSTLMKILFGLERADTGTIRIHGRPMRGGSIPASLSAGVGMVQQHFAQAPGMRVWENLALARRREGDPLLLSRRHVVRRATQVAESLGATLDMDARVDRLSVGERQRLEIVKALQQGARILVLDEPTAILAPGEISSLMAGMRRLADEGTSILFVSHKLNEVLGVCDDVTVMRRGAVVHRCKAHETTARALSRAMVGEDIPPLPPLDQTTGDLCLAVDNLAARNDRGMLALRGVSLTVRHGEIVGVAGIEGNGQEELIEAIAGARESTGSLTLNGRPIDGLAPSDRRRLGLAYIPSDRLGVGSAPTLTVLDNLLATVYRSMEFSTRAILRGPAATAYARRLLGEFDIRAESPTTRLSDLSGGNIQKVVVARETDVRPELLLIAHPTRGIDLGAIDHVHRHLLQLRTSGTATLLLSSELDELLALCDRIVVLFNGEIAAELRPGQTDIGEIGEYMTGTRKADRGKAGE